MLFVLLPQPLTLIALLSSTLEGIELHSLFGRGIRELQLVVVGVLVKPGATIADGLRFISPIGRHLVIRGLLCAE